MSREIKFKKSILPMVLSILILFLGIIDQGFAAAPNGAAKAASSEVKDPSEVITLLVALKERKQEKRTGIRSIEAKELTTQEKIREKVLYARAARETFYESLKKLGINYKVVETYDVAYVGLAMEVERQYIDTIKNMEDVESVEISQIFKAPKKPIMPRSTYTTMDASSNKMVEATKAWKKNYAGKGSVIAVIDSGLDPYHECMKLTDSNSGKFKSESEVKKLIDDLDIARGQYFNSKVPFGYNYANKSTSIKEADPMSHGMHVSGIVAGNSQKIQGVAPEAQIVFLRVFGGGMFGNGTSAEIYTKAIDDAIKLGVDSMNISIGSPAGTEDYVFPNTVTALENAKQAGILVAIAAGNNGFFGYSPGLNEKPKAENPDIGMLADPSVSPNSLSVASIQNMEVAKKGIQSEGDDRILSFQPTVNAKVTDQWVSLKDCAYGRKQDFTEDGNGSTYALIERGEPEPINGEPLSFTEKINNAKAKGYAGVIIYDNEPNMPLIQVEAPGTTIPCAFVNREDGLYLKSRISCRVRFNDDFVFGKSENGGQPSEFSSWGLTPNGNLKPDIAAPGGGILSALNDNQYGVMDGTSMAAPHVAAGVALVKNRVEKDYPSYLGEEKYNFIKKLLMSTAEPYKYEDSGAYASPRQQGSGLMKVDRAIKATAYIEGSNGLTSINLGKSLKGDTVTVNFKIVNLGNDTKNYECYGVLNTDKVEGGKIILKPAKISESKPQHIVVGPKETKDVTIELPITDKAKLEEAMKNGFFLEGFVFCKENDGVNLSAPFVGFYGSFDKLEVAEKSLYDLVKEGKRSYYYNMGKDDDYYGTNIGGEIEKNLIVLGTQADSTKKNPHFEKDKIAFSPNGDGRCDKAIFMATFLRNFGGVELSIVNEAGDKVYYSNNPEDHGVKNFFVDPRMGNMFAENMMTTKPHWQWNGNDLNSKPLPDGNYKMTVKVAAAGKKIDNDSQVLEFPIIMDRVYPRVTKAYFSEDMKTYTIESIEENGSGILSVLLKKGKETIKPQIHDGKYVFDIKDINPKDYEVEINDQARNDIKYPLEKGVRTGNERSVRIKALAGIDSVPSEAYNFTIQTLDGHIVDPNNLTPGKYNLVIDLKDGKYKLIGDRVREFEIKDEDKVKELEVRFETVETTDVFISINNAYSINATLVIKNKDVEGQEFTVSANKSGQVSVKLPKGNYTIEIKGIEEGHYALVKDGEDFTVGNSSIVTKQIKIDKILSKDIRVQLNRKGYSGRLRLKLTGLDIDRTTQYIDFEPGQDEKTVNIKFIPSNVQLLDMEDGYFGLTDSSKTWKAPRSASVMSVTLKKLDQIDPNYIDKNKLRELVAKAREVLDNKSQYETESEEDQRNWKYIVIYLPLAEQTLFNEKATQDEVDRVCNNLNEGLSKLRKKGESMYDLSKLKEVISRAEALKAEDYIEDTWKKVSDALNKAKEMLNKSDNERDQSLINIKIDYLNDAIDELKRKDNKPLVDKKVLQDALNKFEEAKYNSDDYTQKTYNRLEQAVDIAREILGRPFPSQDSVDKAAKELNGAMENLEFTQKKLIQDEREALNSEIAEALKLQEEDYTVESWHRFQESIKKAQEIANNENSSRGELEFGRRQLKETIENLEKRIEEAPTKTEELELPFTALHASEERESMAAGVFNSPAKVIKKTFKDGSEHFDVVINCKVLRIKTIEGHLKDILYASSDEAGLIDTMPLINKVYDNNGDLTSITISMGNEIKEEHFIKVKYKIGTTQGTNEDVMRLRYDISKMKPIGEPEEDTKLQEAKDALTDAIKSAEEKITAGKYTEDSKDKLNKAIEEAKVALEGKDITEIEKATKAVSEAAEKLVAEVPTPTPEPNPQPGPTPGPEPSPQPGPTPGPEPSPQPGPTPGPEPSPQPGPAPRPEPSPQPGPTPRPEPNPIPRPNPWPRVEPRHEEPKKFNQVEIKKENKEVKEISKGNKMDFKVKVPTEAYVKGFPDGSFKPDQVVTRAEAAQILGQFIESNGKNKLSKDMESNTWYTDNMAKLYGLNILTGSEDGKLRPQAGMKRAELAVIISKMLNLKPESAKFKDVKSNDWYSGYVGAVQAKGIISGYTDGSFGGDRTVTRAELISIVNRAFNVVKKGKETNFKDLSPKHWAYKEIQKAAN